MNSIYELYYVISYNLQLLMSSAPKMPHIIYYYISIPETSSVLPAWYMCHKGALCPWRKPPPGWRLLSRATTPSGYPRWMRQISSCRQTTRMCTQSSRSRTPGRKVPALPLLPAVVRGRKNSPTCWPRNIYKHLTESGLAARKHTP